MARRGWSVALLESRRIAWNASGRNDGFVLPGFAESMDKVVSRVGLSHAKALWALSEMGLKYVGTAIAEGRMPRPDATDRTLGSNTVGRPHNHRTLPLCLAPSGAPESLDPLKIAPRQAVGSE